jgi:hypothetical protein
MTTTTCPSLQALLLGELNTEEREHVSSCLRCQILLRNRPEASTNEPGAPNERQAFRETSADPVFEDAEPGDLALLSAPGTDTHVVAFVLQVKETEAKVVPVSSDTWAATEWDLLLDSSVLGYPAIAQVWNYGSVLIEQLRDVAAQAPEAVTEQMRMMYGAAIQSAEVPAGLPVGPRVLSDEDPRLLAQDEAAEAARVYWEPLITMSGIASVAELVSSRSEELSLSREELKAAVGDRLTWLDELESGRRDLRKVLSPAQLAEVFKKLAVPRSRRLGEIVLATIAATSLGVSAEATGLSFARRRRGSWLPSEGAPQLTPEAYVKALLDALETDDRLLL